MDRHVFFAREDGSYPDEADQVVRSESVFPDFEIVDLDRNRRLDLVIPYFHIAPSQAFKMVTQNTLRVQLRMFLLRDDGRFAQGEGKKFARVDRRVVIDYHFDVMRLLFGARHGGRGGPPEHFAPLITARGDFDGDADPDLATDSGRDELDLRFGTPHVEYEREPASSLAHDLVDVDGDGRSDVVSYLGAPAERVAADARPQAELRRNTRPTTEPDGTAPDAAPAEPGTRIQLLLSR